MNDDSGFYDDDANLAVAGPPMSVSRRPKLSSHLPIRFTPEILQQARRCAIEDGMSVSSWVRLLVEREVTRRTPSITGPRMTDWSFHGPVPPTSTVGGELAGAL